MINPNKMFILKNLDNDDTVFKKDPELIFIKDIAVLQDFVLGNNGRVHITNNCDTGKMGKSVNNTVMDCGQTYVYESDFSENTKVEYAGTKSVKSLENKVFQKILSFTKGDNKGLRMEGEQKELKFIKGNSLFLEKGLLVIKKQ
ncbi:hypothetical protein [Bartonella sp. B41]